MEFTNEIFYKLLDNVKEQEYCDIENFSIILEIDDYIIECYKWYANFGCDNTLNFEYCGSMVFGKYEDMTLTEYQYKLLEDKFDEMSNQWLDDYRKSIV